MTLRWRVLPLLVSAASSCNPSFPLKRDKERLFDDHIS